MFRIFCKDVIASEINSQVKLDFLFAVNYENKRRLQIKRNFLVGFNQDPIPLKLPIKQRRKIKILQRKISKITVESNRARKEINYFKKLIFRNVKLQEEYQFNLAKIISNSAANIILEIDNNSELPEVLINNLSNMNIDLKILTVGLRG